MKLRMLCICGLCLWMFILPVSAAEIDTAGTPPAAGLIEELVPEEMEQLLEGSGFPSVTEIITMTPADFWELTKQYISESFYGMRSAFFSILAICLLCGMLSSLTPSGGDATGAAVEMVAVLCISATVSVQIVDCVTRVGNSLQNCAYFMLSFTPILAVLLAAYGLPATAGVYNLLVLGACQIISQVVSAGLVPAAGAYVALCISAGVSGNKGLWSIASAVKKISSWVLSLMMTVFAGFLTLQGFMSSGTDNLTIHTTKFLVGNLVPVVGSAISDALGAAQGSIQLIKNAVGTAGIVVVLLTFLPILIEVVLWRMALGLAAACGEIMGVGSVSKLLASFADVMAVLCAVILSVGLLMIISTAVMLAISAG